MENIIAAKSKERTCGSCSHWHFTVAYNFNYIGWCKVRRQHLEMLNSREEACLDYKQRSIKQSNYSD